jgi:hypothetical protein
LSPLGPPNGVLVGTIVPIYRKGIEENGIVKRMKAYCKVFGKALDAASFAWILTVKPLWIKLVAQTQRFVFLVQSR